MGETEVSVCGKWRRDAQVEWRWWVALGCWQGTDSMCQYQACTCSAASVTLVMSNGIHPLAQELNLNGIETSGTVYIDLSDAIIVSEVHV